LPCLAVRLGVGDQHGIRQGGHEAQALLLDRRVETADSPWCKYEIGWLTVSGTLVNIPTSRVPKALGSALPERAATAA
jgi:hypothetical protein